VQLDLAVISATAAEVAVEPQHLLWPAAALQTLSMGQLDGLGELPTVV
jgi:hypothetical protein